jgi:CheY-like chemotaxis protein
MHDGMAVIVDDDESIREAVYDMLQEIGAYSIVTAEDGEEALKHLRNGGIRLLILDLMMPKIDGYEVLSNLRNGAVPRPVRVVVMSAHADPGAREGIIAMGADEFLPKPFNMSQLQSAISDK